jgi:ABC-type bacteriocin/lantibiotic exporter with double-glycine peptidase domain
MLKVEGVKPKKQQKTFTCGPASLRTIFYFYGTHVSEQELVNIADIGEEGTGEYQMRMLAREYGYSFWSRSNSHLKEVEKWIERGVPILICYQDWGKPNGENGHYAVLTGIDKDWVEIADPANHDGTPVAHSKRMMKSNFLKRWFEVEDGETIRRWFAIVKPKKKKK